jgi:hypothetical protein
MELTNQEKIDLLNVWISNMDFHIDAQKKAMLKQPIVIIDEKPKAQEILDELIIKQSFYVQELDKLNTEML